MDNMESKEEKIQAIALNAIKAVTNTNNPVQFASLNYTVYEVALMAVKMAMKECEM